MERDPNISKLIRESGIASAPDHFTSQVMEKIGTVPEKKTYKPIIGKKGQWMIILCTMAIVVISLIYADPGNRLLKSSGDLSEIEWKMPEINFNLAFLQEINIPTAILAAVAALFVLVLSDAGFSRKRLA